MLTSAEAGHRMAQLPSSCGDFDEKSAEPLADLPSNGGGEDIQQGPLPGSPRRIR